MAKNSFLKVLGDRDPKQCAVIVGDREENTADISVERGIGLIIITGGTHRHSDAIVEAAKKAGVTLDRLPIRHRHNGIYRSAQAPPYTASATPTFSPSLPTKP